jgi:hypothetical protein
VAKCQLVVVSIIQDVHQVGVERVDVVQLREVVDDIVELLLVVGLRKLHLAHVETPDFVDGIARVDDGRCLALRARKHDVDEVLRTQQSHATGQEQGHAGGGTAQWSAHGSHGAGLHAAHLCRRHRLDGLEVVHRHG